MGLCAAAGGWSKRRAGGTGPPANGCQAFCAAAGGILRAQTDAPGPAQSGCAAFRRFGGGRSARGVPG